MSCPTSTSTRSRSTPRPPPSGPRWARCRLGRFPRGGRTLRRARRRHSRENGDYPLAAGATLAGFRVVRSEREAELALEGRHPFSRHALTFRIDVPEPGRVRLRAETRAAFPRLRGRLYRALVIGTGLHAVVVRGLLQKIGRRAERTIPPAGIQPR